MKRTLITGMSGLVGGALRRRLESVGGYELTALNRGLLEGVKCFRADIADFDAIKPAFANQDVVVHLAAYQGAKDWEGHLRGNIVGTYNVFEAARLAGVRRVIYASSGNVARGFESVPPYDAITSGKFDCVPEDFAKITHEQMRPVGIYGAAKIFGEGLARHYSDEYGMSMICVRIGSVNRSDVPEIPRERSTFISQADIATMLQSCIDAADDLKYDTFFATSTNMWGYRDISHAKEVLGWVPKDSADAFYDD